MKRKKNIMWKPQKTTSNNTSSYFNMGEIDKSRELNSREGDNSSLFEVKQLRGKLETHYSKGWSWQQTTGRFLWTNRQTDRTKTIYPGLIMTKTICPIYRCWGIIMPAVMFRTIKPLCTKDWSFLGGFLSYRRQRLLSRIELSTA